MKKLLTMLVCMALLGGVGASQEKRSKFEADERTARQIRDALKDFEAAWNRQDVDKLASFYSEDAEVFIPEMPVVRGRDQIRETYKQMLSGPNAPKLSIVADSILRSGDLVVESGHFTMTIGATAGAPTENGKYVTVSRKDGDKWKIIRDIFNSDAPKVQPR
jgi:uncharacterized protein (TIGR02246 family)